MGQAATKASRLTTIIQTKLTPKQAVQKVEPAVTVESANQAAQSPAEPSMEEIVEKSEVEINIRRSAPPPQEEAEESQQEQKARTKN